MAVGRENPAAADPHPTAMPGPISGCPDVSWTRRLPPALPPGERERFGNNLSRLVRGWFRPQWVVEVADGHKPSVAHSRRNHWNYCQKPTESYSSGFMIAIPIDANAETFVHWIDGVETARLNL